eukprot:5244199-Pyramimonas_sp.AAC.1
MSRVLEHHAVGDRLQALRREALDVGYHGIWAEALTTEDGGTSGGVCVLTTSDVMVTDAPFVGQLSIPPA